MSQENVEIVRRLHGAMNAADWEAVLALLDPEIVWVQNPNSPDSRTVHGHDGMREFREMVSEAFEELRLEVDRFIDADDQVVALGYMRARGVGSRVEVRETRAWVWTLRDGKIVRHETYDNHEAAFVAAGLSD